MKLSICMMVKNETKYLRQCLNSLKSIRDEIDSELIIVDTGSTDNTVEIAKEFTDKVYFHQWNNNFSEMRNITIKYSIGEWILIIDGDEIISEPNGIINFFSLKGYLKNNTACLKCKNFKSSDNVEEYSLIISPRLFKKDKDFQYEGAVHNLPKYKEPIIIIKSELLHYGYVTDDKKLMEKKFNRTTNILKKELTNDPDNLYYIYQLSVSYGMHGDMEASLETIIRAYDLVKTKNLNTDDNLYIVTHLAKMYLINKKFYEVEKICSEVIENNYIYIDLYFYLGKAQFRLSKNIKAIENYKKYLEKLNQYNSAQTVQNLSIIHDTLGKADEVYLDLSCIYENEGDYKEALRVAKEVSTKNNLSKAFKKIISMYIKLNKEDALKDYYDNEILLKERDVQNTFILNLETILINLGLHRKMNIWKSFSEADSQYSLLNVVRINEDNFNNGFLAELYSLNFSELPDFFGDVLYALIYNKISLEGFIDKVSDYKIKSFINYLSNSHQDLCEKLCEYLKIYENEHQTITSLRINKILTFHVLSSEDINDINDVKYKDMFEKYLKYGWEYLKTIYNETILDNQLECYMKDEEDLFLYHMHFALESKSDKTIFKSRLRSALSSCPYLKRGIELLIEEKQTVLIENINEMEEYKIKVKQTISELIELNNLNDASRLIKEYEGIVEEDFEIYSMKAVIEILEGRFEDAEILIISVIDKFKNNFDLNYNLAFLYEKRENFEGALIYYKKALENCDDEKLIIEIKEVIDKISVEQKILNVKDKKKIIFFVKQGMDSFLGDIISELSHEYETKKIVVQEFKQIDEGMQWADICWFEWCDELIGYGSKLDLAKERKIICRIHGYEVYGDLIKKPNWKNVDDLIIVAPHIRRIFEENTEDLMKGELRIHTIFCGINVNKYPMNIKKKGFNLGYLGYINFKKNIPLTLDIFKKMYDQDNRYKFYIAGEFQDSRTLSFIKYFIKEFKLQNNIFFDGWKDEDQKIEWFKKIDYMVISSIDEGLCFAAGEAMCSGIKPILHNCEGIKDHYDKKYIFNTQDEAVAAISSSKYHSTEYRRFIENNYSLKRELENITIVLKKYANTDSN